MTVERLEAEVSGPSDLSRVRIAVVTNTTSERYARAAGLDFRRVPDLDTALAAVSAEEVDAVVHDAPLLEQLLAGEWGEGLELLPSRFQRQDYAIALPEGSALREPINRLLPEKLRDGGLGDPRLGDMTADGR